MKMHVLSGGALKMRRSVYFPGADRSESIELPVSCMLLRHAAGNILFDTGCHPSVADDAEQRWGSLARAMQPIMPRDQNLIEELNRLGMNPDDIDVVINSHLHSDHCGCNEFFTRATVYVHEAELEAAHSANAGERGYIAADWAHPMPINLVGEQTDLLNDGRIVLIPLPGHTPGSMGALVNLDRSGSFLLASDTVSIRENLDQEIIPRITWNADALMDSLSEIRRIEDTGATLICGHDMDQWHELRRGRDYYD